MHSNESENTEVLRFFLKSSYDITTQEPLKFSGSIVWERGEKMEARGPF